SLGLGTLVLIALIVMIFSPGNSDLKREIQGLRSDVSELRKLIEKQTSEIQQLREGLGKDK
ncbi:MAG: hypothetical protein MUC83_19045, partial [Pirellula sp.]|nr:hypothetical protein [Pirellula sp.]